MRVHGIKCPTVQSWNSGLTGGSGALWTKVQVDFLRIVEIEVLLIKDITLFDIQLR